METLTESAQLALDHAIRFARETRWDSLRSPHIFMGLLAEPDASIQNWGDRLDADLSSLLNQFLDLFFQEEGESEPYLSLNREFFSDNVIRFLREASQRAATHNRSVITAMDLLVCLLTSSNSIVAEYFERIGVTPAKLTEIAIIAEQQPPTN